MRRQNRQVTDLAEIQAILSEIKVARLGMQISYLTEMAFQLWGKFELSINVVPSTDKYLKNCRSFLFPYVEKEFQMKTHKKLYLILLKKPEQRAPFRPVL